MTSPVRFELTDAAIERMLANRAGSEAPIGLVSGVMATVESTKQERGGWLPRLVPARASGNRAFMLAAGAALVTLTVVAGFVGSWLLRPPTMLVVPPPVPTATVTPTPSITPTPSPSPTPVATPTPVDNGPMIVYHLGADAAELFTLDSVSGERVALGNLQNRTGPGAGQSIHWSADREHAIVFGSSDSVLARIDVIGKSVEPLRISVGGYRDAVSPAGDLVARLTEDGSRLVVSVLDLGGEEVHRSAPLPEGVTPLIGISWSPDGSSLFVSSCFPCETSPEHHHLFRVPIDGSPVQDLVDSTSGYFGWMSWSPDGSTLAYSNVQSGETTTGGIGTVRIPDGLVTQLTATGGEAPAWSPDGSRIAFARGFGAANPGIHVMNADGTNVTRLTTAGSGVTDGDRDPRWSPDGRSILFSRGPYDASLGDLYLVPVAGGEPRLLVKNAVADW